MEEEKILRVLGEDSEAIAGWTDSYFLRTQAIADREGDVPVTYAFFMRKDVLAAPRIALAWLHEIAKAAAEMVEINYCAPEGSFVPAREPFLFISGSWHFLLPLETLLLQKLGLPSLVAKTAFDMCLSLPQTDFLAFEARHCAGRSMVVLAEYGLSVANSAVRSQKAKGFLGGALHATASFFGQAEGLGTFPHNLVGFAGSTLQAAKLYREAFFEAPLVVLVDYFGREKTDALEVCRFFEDLAHKGRLSFRLDTSGERYLEGLDEETSVALIQAQAPDVWAAEKDTPQRDFLVGKGVSAAAVLAFRRHLESSGFPCVKIVVSSGFTLEKCRIFARARVVPDMVGTGSFLPERWQDTFVTADVIRYGSVWKVKKGREFLIEAFEKKCFPK